MAQVTAERGRESLKIKLECMLDVLKARWCYIFYHLCKTTCAHLVLLQCCRVTSDSVIVLSTKRKLLLYFLTHT